MTTLLIILGQQKSRDGNHIANIEKEQLQYWH